MTEVAALRAATRDAADLLRLPQVGRIEPGAIADLCAFAGTALRPALTRPPTLVMMSGRVVRERALAPL
jgi:imidazolonepropionase-like amidohydrolase